MPRLDQVLVDRGLCESREKAKRSILAGQVRINGHTAAKASDSVKESDTLQLDAGERYVSRGGFKLEHALKHFAVDPTGLTAVDLGASTGGFTDCLLQHGASRIWAVDVGQGQLAWKLRTDARVVVMEKTNARDLTPERMGAAWAHVDLIVVDCSFISLRKILPTAVALVRPSGRIVALVKPQFEAGKEEADRGRGVIRDPAIHQRVLAEIEQFATSRNDLNWCGCTESPLLGPAGNKEFLVLLERSLSISETLGHLRQPRKNRGWRPYHRSRTPC